MPGTASADRSACAGWSPSSARGAGWLQVAVEDPVPDAWWAASGHGTWSVDRIYLPYRRMRPDAVRLRFEFAWNPPGAAHR